jgi:hypothetical protein
MPVILTICLLFHISCSEDLLEPKPLSFFAPNNIYTNKAGFESLLVTMRKNLVSDFIGTASSNLLLFEAQATEFGCGWELNFSLFLVPASSNLWSNSLTVIYRYIKDANVLISRLDNIKWDNENDRNSLLAEAYWHRSYWYYRLVNGFGDVPFVGKEVTDVKLDYKTHSRWAILSKIQSDMEFAVQWLPVTAVPGVPTKGAGNHLLAKICLANCEFDKAITAATNVINGGYALMTTRFGSFASDPAFNVLWDLHRVENKNIPANTETLLAIVDRYTDPEGAKTSSGTYVQRLYNCSWWHSLVKDKDGNRATIDKGDQYRNWGRGNPDCMITNWYAYDVWNDGGYTWKNTPDLRRGADTNWVEKDEIISNNPASSDYGKPVQIKNLGDPIDSLWLIWPMAHYKTFVPEQNPLKTPMGGNGDWYVFRLAETYLLRAEAYFWKGQHDLAASDINMVRQRANATPISSSDVTIDYIFDERARELWIEEPRHNELVRASFILAKLNRDGYSLETFHEKNWAHQRVNALNHFYILGSSLILYGSSPLYLPHHTLWPIPDQVILANTLAVINQNKGYVGDSKNVQPLENIDDSQ